MKKAIGTVDISYQVDCPHCDGTNYSDSSWDNLEYGDGLPHGVLECDFCKKEFEVEIEG